MPVADDNSADYAKFRRFIYRLHIPLVRKTTRNEYTDINPLL